MAQHLVWRSGSGGGSRNFPVDETGPEQTETEENTHEFRESRLYFHDNPWDTHPLYVDDSVATITDGNIVQY